MSKTILFIDGENFLHKIEDVLKKESKAKGFPETVNLDFNKLFSGALKGLEPSRKIFYGAKLHFNAETPKKSSELIKAQRKLINSLKKQGFEFVMAGNVRGQKVGKSMVFREKGVDVKIAVDLVSLACDDRLKNILYIRKEDNVLDIIPDIKPHYLERIKETQEAFQRLVNHVEVVKRAEKQLFDNVIHIAEDLIKQAEREIQDIVKAQDEMLKTVIGNYNILAFSKEVILKEDAKYRLTTEAKPDEEWVKESIDHLIEIAERESGYTYRIEN